MLQVDYRFIKCSNFSKEIYLLIFMQNGYMYKDIMRDCEQKINMNSLAKGK